MEYNEILGYPPFKTESLTKNKLITSKLKELTQFHYTKCIQYKRIIDALHCDIQKIDKLSDIPFLPVSLFKEIDLLSVDRSEILKVMTSSGTSGQRVSKIFLDKKTATNQQKTLVKIVSDFLGSSRLPMVIIDSPSVISNRENFSARGGGILGFSIFGSDKIYALNEDMSLNFENLKTFLKKYEGKQILLFGFTFMVWQHFYKELLKLDEKIDFSKGTLIHGGGWKKLITESVSPIEFKNKLGQVCGLTNIHDYYGMVEQTGCINMECEYGHLHASTYSDIIIRNYNDFSENKIGEPGIIQVLSMLPESYPGHSLLTEDEGVIIGEDDCKCGRKGKYFKIFGRLKNAEIRGCSDTYATKFK